MIKTQHPQTARSLLKAKMSLQKTKRPQKVKQLKRKSRRTVNKSGLGDIDGCDVNAQKG